MEDTHGNLQNSRYDLKKSTGRQDDGPYSNITTHISSGDNSKTKTLIEYENDETLEIKEELIQDQGIHESGDHNFEPEKSHPDERSIFFDKSFGGRMLIKYENDETLEIKEEVIQDQKIHQTGDHNFETAKNHADERSSFFDKDSGGRTLIKYENDETLEIKEEMIQDQQRKLSGDDNLLPDKNQLEGRSIFSGNNSGCTTVIEYDNDETMEIKEEIIQDRENTGKTYELQVCAEDIRVDDTFTIKDDGYTPIKQKMQESKQSKKKKTKASQAKQARYNCDKCSRSYSWLSNLKRHERLTHAEVKPQVICDFCDYKTNLKSDLSRHISSRHFRKSQISQAKHKCDKCSRRYSSISGLNKHNRLKHAAFKPQFICEFCDYKINVKSSLSKHISSHHFKKSETSQARHNCNKCPRSYSSVDALKQHDRLKHAAVKPEFICGFCDYKADLKSSLSKHISVRHFTQSNTSQARHNCAKCFRRYSTKVALIRHDRLKHPKE